ncbi:hypothetical protein BVY01_01465, partial [bacterium I07]
DYFRSGLNIILREGILLPSGYHCIVRGNIPINSGTSSSSAMMIAWIKFLLFASDDERKDDPGFIAALAHRAEVLEFNEPGGMMDHFASSYGSVLHIDFGPPVAVESLKGPSGSFVLGDSMEPKDTRGILARVKDGTLDALKSLQSRRPDLSMRNINMEILDHYRSEINDAQYTLLKSNIVNRELTIQARALFQSSDDEAVTWLGRLLSAHQKELRDGLQISTPKIDRMIDAARKAGALGGKINGSGGGGCMFAYSPGRAEAVAGASAREGGKPYIISIGSGASLCEEGQTGL